MNQLQMQQSHLQLIVQHAIGSSGRLAVGLQSNYNRRQTLIMLGLAPKGGNYARLNRLMVTEVGFEPTLNEA